MLDYNTAVCIQFAAPGGPSALIPSLASLDHDFQVLQRENFGPQQFSQYARYAWKDFILQGTMYVVSTREAHKSFL